MSQDSFQSMPPLEWPTQAKAADMATESSEHNSSNHESDLSRKPYVMHSPPHEPRRHPTENAKAAAFERSFLAGSDLVDVTKLHKSFARGSPARTSVATATSSSSVHSDKVFPRSPRRIMVSPLGTPVPPVSAISPITEIASSHSSSESDGSGILPPPKRRRLADALDAAEARAAATRETSLRMKSKTRETKTTKASENPDAFESDRFGDRCFVQKKRKKRQNVQKTKQKKSLKPRKKLSTSVLRSESMQRRRDDDGFQSKSKWSKKKKKMRQLTLDGGVTKDTKRRMQGPIFSGKNVPHKRGSTNVMRLQTGRRNDDSGSNAGPFAS